MREEAAGASGAAVEEREVKLAVPDDFVLPSLSGLDSLTTLDEGEEVLRSVYWDTGDLALVRAGVGVRHRNGIWTFKGPSRRDGDAVVREELEVAAPGDVIPALVRSRIGPLLDPSTLHPVVTLDNLRHRLDVRDGAGSAELVHDRVAVLDGARVVARFTEVEVEFSPAGQAIADSLVHLLLAHGAVVDPTPKYARALRALGLDPPHPSA
ncbi:MAG TPA: CYTH domain-containing protein [Candidatus Dormibacteraeota bacterium]|jgi:inorganic triphosphatase YgiF|nr:CYTH domain-containing protein [Candidatus Dormibacteraeota bacterium]